MPAANLALRFLLELAAFAALALAGAAVGPGAWSVVLAILAPAAAVAVWARWNAPRSDHRLPTPARVPLELAVFAVAGAGLVAAGARVWAALFLALVLVNALAMTGWHQWDA